MKMRKRIFAKAAFIPVVFGAALLIYSVVFGASGRNGLYFLTTQEEAVGGDYLVVVTHGWVEKGADWPKDMAEAISGRVDANEWRCVYFNWSEGAMTINPADAAEYARDFAGEVLAEQVLKLNSNFRHIHLIGHSSGCWAVSEAAKGHGQTAMKTGLYERYFRLWQNMNARL
jgi:pimeloyl-ACP methyl ester carboxylesterase